MSVTGTLKNDVMLVSGGVLTAGVIVYASGGLGGILKGLGEGGSELLRGAADGTGTILESVAKAPVQLGVGLGNVIGDAIFGTEEEQRTKNNLLDQSLVAPDSAPGVALKLKNARDAEEQQKIFQTYLATDKDFAMEVLKSYRKMFGEVFKPDKPLTWGETIIGGVATGIAGVAGAAGGGILFSFVAGSLLE